MKTIIGVTLIAFFFLGCESKPHYRINGCYVTDYSEEKGCVIYDVRGNERKVCGKYKIIARGGAKLKRVKNGL